MSLSKPSFQKIMEGEKERLSDLRRKGIECSKSEKTKWLCWWPHRCEPKHNTGSTHQRPQGVLVVTCKRRMRVCRVVGSGLRKKLRDQQTLTQRKKTSFNKIFCVLLSLTFSVKRPDYSSNSTEQIKMNIIFFKKALLLNDAGKHWIFNCLKVKMFL